MMRDLTVPMDLDVNLAIISVASDTGALVLPFTTCALLVLPAVRFTSHAGKSVINSSQGLRWLALAWLACLLCLALAWSGLGLSCLPCLGLVQQQQQRRRSRRRPPKAAGCCCWQGRQDRPRPDQAKAGHNRQASQAKAGVPISKGPKWSQVGPSGPKWAQVGPKGPQGAPSGPKWALGPQGGPRK